MNPIEQRAEKDQNLRFLFPDSTWVWVLTGEMSLQEIDKARPLINRDLLRLGVLAKNKATRGVLLVKDTDPAAPFCKKAAKMIQGLDCVVLDESLKLKNPDAICLHSANMVLMYGKPSEQWYELLDSYEGNVPVIERLLEKVGKEERQLHKDSDPYSKYKAIVELVREWWVEPYRGLQTRDLIDIRPHRTIN
jgi:hypothetical protein